LRSHPVGKSVGGERDGRTELATILDFLRPGDEFMLTRLDRLGRDRRDVLNLIRECEQKSAFVPVLDSHVSTRGEMGHIVLTVPGMAVGNQAGFHLAGGCATIEVEVPARPISLDRGRRLLHPCAGCKRVDISAT
jgi:hypothetical protein